LSPLLVGLTIVSAGTSSPELAATLAGVLKGAPAVAYGNVVGSNIANLGLVLGTSAVIFPLAVAGSFIRRDVPIMLVVCASLFGLSLGGRVGRGEGILLLVLLAGYLSYLWRREREASWAMPAEEGTGAPPRLGLALSLAAVLAGVGLLVSGAELLIRGAVSVAASLGVEQRVIGLTAVAFGTSLPELASSLVAAARREADIVLGNVIGSNVLNVLLILGATATVRPLEVEIGPALVDLTVMTALGLLAWFFLATRSRLSKLEGLVLLAAYCVYVGRLFA
jgi:cation:H+ antiporter